MAPKGTILHQIRKKSDTKSETPPPPSVLPPGGSAYAVEYGIHREAIVQPGSGSAGHRMLGVQGTSKRRRVRPNVFRRQGVEGPPGFSMRPERGRSRLAFSYSITFRLGSASGTPAAIQTINGSATRPRLPLPSSSRLPLQFNSRPARKGTP